jgi:DNA-binding LytR/AlgR family response regulator
VIPPVRLWDCLSELRTEPSTALPVSIEASRGRADAPLPARAGSPFSGRDRRIVARSTGNTLVFIPPSDVWAFEARQRLVLVHAPQGCFDIDLPLVEVEPIVGPLFLRVHRNWLVGLAKVRELRPGHGEIHLFVGMAVAPDSTDRRGVEVPVARDRVKRVRRELLAGTFGLRNWLPAKADAGLDGGRA